MKQKASRLKKNPGRLPLRRFDHLHTTLPRIEPLLKAMKQSCSTSQKTRTKHTLSDLNSGTQKP